MVYLSKLTDLFFDSIEYCGLKNTRDSESDKTCFRQALNGFLKRGDKEDAFVVYFCFSELFKLFGEGYDNTKKLLEMLSDHEYHSGELLSKHRDHYSHSVYVFALGLAVFASDTAFRDAFLDFYGLKQKENFQNDFLYLWGMTSLFHDIGYPFQLAHEQIVGYTKELWPNNENNIYVSFGNYDKFVELSADEARRVRTDLAADRDFETLNDVFAYGLNLRKGYDEKRMSAYLKKRIVSQPSFLDHGYFSAVILARQILNRDGIAFDLKRLDILTAILQHNSLARYDLKNEKPMKYTEHPLAYLLMLADELQNWDRLAYGKVSKLDPIAWNVKLEISDDRIDLEYMFDSCTIKDAEGKMRLNKSFEIIQNGVFGEGITGSGIKKGMLAGPLVLNARAVVKPKTKKSTLYASDNNFINLCDFARAVHASYIDLCREKSLDALTEDFENLPLEFKVSNIEQAKSYAYKLELINCFYSSKDLDYPVVDDFRSAYYGENGADNLGFLAREEHLRWVREKLQMGWKYGTDYASTAERNSKKIHKDIVPYEILEESEREKDELMINNIIPFLKKFGHNIRIYSYRTGRKPVMEIAGIGHRSFKDDPETLKSKIKSILAEYSKTNHVIVRTCYAAGADQLIAECACEMGIYTKAALPDDYESYICRVRDDCNADGMPFTYDDELRMRHLLAQTVVCKVLKDDEDYYRAAVGYLLQKSKKLIVLVDDDIAIKESLSRDESGSGTMKCLRLAKEYGLRQDEDIHVIKCHRW